MSSGGTTTTTTGPDPESARIAGEFQLEGIERSGEITTRQINQAIEELRRQEGVAREDLAPFREAGLQGLENLQALQTGGLSELEQTPGFQFRQEQANKGLQANLATRGLLNSGANLRATSELNQNLAAQEFQGEFGRRASLAGLGTNASSQQAALSSGLGSNIAGLQTQLGQTLGQGQLAAGQSRASSVPGIHNQTQTTSQNMGFGSILGAVGTIGGLLF